MFSLPGNKPTRLSTVKLKPESPKYTLLTHSCKLQVVLYQNLNCISIVRNGPDRFGAVKYGQLLLEAKKRQHDYAEKLSHTPVEKLYPGFPIQHCISLLRYPDASGLTLFSNRISHLSQKIKISNAILKIFQPQ